MKTFISYSLEDKKEAGHLHDRLNLLGFDCFLAHHDIPKGAKWHDAILQNLKASNVFIPILTEKAIASPWVQQECGMAHLLKSNRKAILIIPLTVDHDEPPGCLSVYQSIRAGTKFFSLGKVKMEDELTLRLAAEIVNQSSSPDAIKLRAIRNLRGQSWRDAQYILEFLQRCKGVDYPQFLELVQACRANFAVVYSDRGMTLLYRFLETHRAEISNDPQAVAAWNDLHKRHGARKAEEKRQLEEAQRQLREQLDRQRADGKIKEGAPAGPISG